MSNKPTVKVQDVYVEHKIKYASMVQNIALAVLVSFFATLTWMGQYFITQSEKNRVEAALEAKALKNEVSYGFKSIRQAFDKLSDGLSKNNTQTEVLEVNLGHLEKRTEKLENRVTTLEKDKR